MNTDRRTAMETLMIAAGASVLSLPLMAANPGELSEAEYKKLANAPKTAADHKALAKHYRAVAANHEAEAKMFDSLSAIYAKGVPVATPGSAHELAHAAKHAAEHARDFAEAASDLAEIHEGIAAGPV